MKRYVLFFDEIDLHRVPEVGGKAANLGQLTRWGFPVPPGFCVAAAALDEVLAAPGLREEVARLAAGLCPSRLDSLETDTARIRALIEQAPLPGGVEEAIREAWDRLCAALGENPRVAVRSSVATRDGSRSSFPGQMDTYHNLGGIERVLDGIRRCWASSWTARAAGTRIKLGLGPQQVVVAPVVQAMVWPDAAGVLFTADPLTGDTDRILVDAAYGLGEAVVSGGITPDQYVVEKGTLRVMRRRAGNQTYRIVADEARGCGTCRTPMETPAERAGCLSDAQLEALTGTGRSIEERYGGVPQDVEWAFCQGRLFILQSRRIAGLRKPDRESRPSRSSGGALVHEKPGEFDTAVSDPPCTYTSANISEVLPGVLTPLTAHGLKPLDYGFWKPLHDLGLFPDPFPEGELDLVFLGIFYGRPHLNLTRFRQIAARVPGGSVAEFDRPFPGAPERADSLPRFRWTPGSVRVLLRFLRNARRMHRRVPRSLALLDGKVAEAYRAFRRLDLTAQPLERLLEAIEQDREEALEVMVLHIENSLMAVAFYEALRALCARWLGDPSGALAARLVTGLTTLESARPNREIFALHRLARASGFLREQFLDTPPETLLGRLRSEPREEARAFLAHWDRFLETYGYRCVNEAEMMLPSWDRDPALVLSLIRNLLRARDPEDPVAVEHRRAQERERALREARGRLPAPRRLLFLWVLAQAQRFIAGREKNKALLMMGIHGVKNVFFELSARLQASGRLRDPRDLYFLTRQEIARLCREADFDPYDRIPRRRLEWERNLAVCLPETFRGRPAPLPPQGEAPAPAGEDEGAVLTGLGVSPGRVTGRARVITDPRSDAFIEEGEILVAPVTDAGWTPLFLMASAIVVDVGGLLSHGSIVAREYGIPGVLNVFTATQRIVTGQMITVDGDRGTVRIHGAPRPG